MFVLNSDITIGKFHFSGVHHVHIKRSMHSYVDTATILLPSICNVTMQGQTIPSTLVTGLQFKDGDPVLIKLGYNSKTLQEFKGFVKRRNLNMPLELECEGYSWLLKRNKINGYWKSISAADLLKKACDGTGITIQVSYNPTLYNIKADDLTGAQLIDLLKKTTDENLAIFFIEPDTLWCGLVYSPFSEGRDVFGIGKVNYRLGFNVIKDNDLQQRTLDDDPLSVNYVNKTADGSILSENSEPLTPALRKYRKLLKHLASAPDLKALAAEKQNRKNYIGYEGRINAFLQPYAAPGYIAGISDERYNIADGQYLVESVEIIFGTKGARRIVEIGPEINYANSIA